jgi:glucan 1,3-beta-glucosidase
MVGETGWPSAGRPRQGASASVVNEARYLREFLRYATEAKLPYNVIEAFDQPWKRALEGTAGGYWGIFDAQARAKFPLQGPVTEEAQWWLGWLAAGVGGALFVLAGIWRRHRRGWRDLAALGLAGIASGGALAWQFRQMWFACRDPWEWAVSSAACALVLFTALRLARWIAARLSGATRVFVPGWLRCGWLFALAYYSLLLVFDGRYRDFPLGLFLLPCMGYAMAGGLTDPRKRAMPRLEERFLAMCLPLLGVVVLAQETGLNPVAWLWLALNLLLAAPVLLAWRAACVRLQVQQA